MWHHPWRFVLSLLLILVSGGWIMSLPVGHWLFPSSPSLPSTSGVLLQQLPQPASYRDLLRLDFALPELGVQQRRGELSWERADRIYRLPVITLSNGQVHHHLIAVGAHPDWRGAVKNVRLYFPHQPAVAIAHVQLVQRAGWALDALIGRQLGPYLPVSPPWPNVLLVTAGLLLSGLALVWPRWRWRQRLGSVGLALGLLVGISVLVAQLRLLAVVSTAYSAVSPVVALIRVPAYNEATALNGVLAEAQTYLPAGAILVVDRDPDSYLVHRARYLLYPRRVDVVSGRLTAAQLQRRLQTTYVGAILRGSIAGGPPPGWQQRRDATTTVALWRTPASQPLRALPDVLPWAPLRLFGALAVVLSLGWAIGGWSGWGGLARWVYAWPIGVTVLAWWMTGLSLLGGPWSWWSIGVPLVAGAAAVGWGARLTRSAPRFDHQQVRWWDVVAGGMVVLLVGCVTAQALLLPFTDWDTWIVWGLRGRAFFGDGNIMSLLVMYADREQTAYPPAHGLAQAWGYLVMGGIREQWVKLIFPLWYTAALGLLWIGLRQWLPRLMTWGWTLFLATTPLLLDHATLGNADLPLMVALLGGALALCRWIEHGSRRSLGFAVLLLSGGAWLKLDGIYLGGIMLGLATLVHVLRLKQGALRRRVLLEGVLAGCGLAALFAPWWWLMEVLGATSAVPSLALVRVAGLRPLMEGLVVMGEELVFSHSNSAWGLLGGGFGALWLISGVTVVCNWRRLRQDSVLQFLVLLIGAGCAFYLGIYAVRPFGSIDRYLLHLAPLAVLAAARSVGFSERISPH